MSYASMRPLLMVANLKESIDFYTDVLGFTVGATWPEENPFWAALSAGSAALMLNYVGDPHDDGDGVIHSHEPEFNGALYFDVEGSIEDLQARIKAKAPSCTEIEVMPYGMKEFSVQDPNGYNLSFGAATE
jgi:catechol 2,3-dioxygenase-like lactoylglutathione lyase family enzyme